ncbi:hypothetical protein M422DRAFT_273033 [Sphaerobolus stellatus SS14]|uniref:Uncharacterized protein n=1 Tax=Sphaerobolus stellatus (strain SS14) TaxID=990650 RepID=A0A0C9TVY2_SPHS4|nr:hypothetical protein M422DRAFT_273033 [Sphaerobolus stellatus SS14]
MFLQADYDTLVDLFKALPPSIPEQPSELTIPPVIDLNFYASEGVWAAFNKAMHAAFGDKLKGLQIREHRKGLEDTLKVIHWCLKALEREKNWNSVELVGLWLSALIEAVKATSSKTSSTNMQSSLAQARPHHNVKPNCELERRQALSNTNEVAKAAPTSEQVKKKYIYYNLDGEEVEEAVPVVVPVAEEASSDIEFEGSDLESSDMEQGPMDIENNELAVLLPCQTEPETKKSHKHAAAAKATEAIEKYQSKKCKHRPSKSKNKSDPPKTLTVEPAAKKPFLFLVFLTLFINSCQASVTGKKQPPIYLFFEVIENDENGQPGQPGDKFYQCYHGKHKILTVMKDMKSSQNGLITYLRNHFPQMYCLWEELKKRNSPPTLFEAQVAAKKIPSDSVKAIEHIKSLRDKLYSCALLNVQPAFELVGYYP